MSDVFISYARATAKEAQAVADALRALGYGVWRDDELPAHRAYADVIEEQLQSAKAVVVIWSAEAVKSQWVFSEANRAREDGKLVQLTVDVARLPMPFDTIQCADLAGWTGDLETPGWKKVVASIGDLMVARPATATAVGAPGKLSVCVLPFANMSGDPEQEYFSDGISEDIITDLSKVSALSVVSRNSAFQFKGRHVDLRQIARQLEVSYVLEGSVRKAGARVRITAQLIEAARDSHVWAERFDRDLDDIFALQDEISRAIVSALKLKLLPEEKVAIAQRGTASPEAYDLDLMARRHSISGNSDRPTLEAIERLATRAIEIDPGYAQAWARLAVTQNTLLGRHGRAGEDGWAAAERALALDDSLAEAHAVKARLLSVSGRSAEADTEIATALRLDPDSYEVSFSAAFHAFRQRRYEDAIRYFEAASALMETSFSAPGMLMTCYAAVGDGEGRARAARTTVARAEKALEQDPGNGAAMALLAGALAALGDGQRARDWCARAVRIDPDNRPMRYNLACALSADQVDLDGAIELLAPYFASASLGELGHAAVDPDLDPLRDDPRFKAIIFETEARLAVANPADAAGMSGSA
jgi:adenylate cyclase